MRDNRYYVYLHLRGDNGEPFYVGKGTNNRHISKWGRSKFWKNIVNKYGYDIIILEENLIQEDAYDLEMYWIKRIGRIDLNNGPLVNHSDGGEKNYNRKSGYKLSDETKYKISIGNRGKKRTDELKEYLRYINLGKKLSDEVRNKLSKSHRDRLDNGFDTSVYSFKGAENPMFGRNHTQEVKNKISLCNKKHYKVIQLTKDGEVVKIFNSHHDASQELNICPKQIMRVINGVIKTTGGFKFKIID